MCETRHRKPSPAIQEKLAIYENVLTASVLTTSSFPVYNRPTPLVLSPDQQEPGLTLGADVDMVQEGEPAAEGGELITPRRLPNPCLESSLRMDLHRELLFNQRIGKNILNQKSELQKALTKHKEKQILNQEKDNKETPELERAIAERARRLEMAEQGEVIPPDPATNPTLQEVRARLRHTTPHPCVPSPTAAQ